MKLEFERLCPWCMPPFDCSILCLVSLHLVCAKFFQGSPPIAKFRQANFRPRDLPSMISFYLAKYCQYLSEISFQTAKDLGISPKYRFQAMQNVGDISGEKNANFGEFRLQYFFTVMYTPTPAFLLRH